MRAHAHLAVRRGPDDRTVIARCFAEAPLLMRETPADRSGTCVHLVGGAAGPLGGDELDICVDVDDGADLTIRSVAASLAQPGADGRTSHAAVTVRVGEAATLDWWPEPLVSVRGSDHEMRAAVAITPTSVLRWVDEVCLGRAGEGGGRLVSRQRIEIGGVPLVTHDLHFGAAGSPGTHGRGRVAITGLVHGPPAQPSATRLDAGIRAARFPIDARTTVWIALGDHHEQLRTALADLGLDRRSSLRPTT